MTSVNPQFNKIWSSYFNKSYATLVENGKTAIFEALKILNSKHVALPTYTCHRVLQACLNAGVTPYIVDCGLDLQIDVNKIPIEVDTVTLEVWVVGYNLGRDVLGERAEGVGS